MVAATARVGCAQTSAESHRSGERGEAISQVLREIAQSSELHGCVAFAPEQLETTTQFFPDLVVSPFLLRSLLCGEKLRSLRAEIESHVSRAVALFISACRSSCRGQLASCNIDDCDALSSLAAFLEIRLLSLSELAQ